MHTHDQLVRDSEDLLYYASRGAEKQHQLTRLRAQTRGMGDLDTRRIPLIEQAGRIQTKFEVARSDLDDILERYAGKVAIVAPLTHVRPNLSAANPMEGIVTIEGTLTKVDYKKALFRIATDSGTVEVQYVDFVLQEGCTDPSPHAAIELELVEPS